MVLAWDDPQPVATDVPLVVEDLLSQVEDLLAVDPADPAIDDLLAQVADLQGR